MKKLKLSAFFLLGAVVFAGCSSTNNVLDPDDVAQGSHENISSLTAVIKANPRDPAGYNVRGSAYGRAGRNKEAIADFTSAISLNPNFYNAYANRALIYRNMGNMSAAIADYNRALAINPNYDVALIGRGNVYRLSGKLDLAYNDFNSAIQAGTTDGRAWHNRALIEQARGDQQQAISDFGAAMSRQPNAPAPYNGRGLSYAALGDWDNAFDDFNAAIRLDSNIAESWSNQAMVYEHRGEKKKAYASYTKAVTLDPNFKPAKEGQRRTRGLLSAFVSKSITAVLFMPAIQSIRGHMTACLEKSKSLKQKFVSGSELIMCFKRIYSFEKAAPSTKERHQKNCISYILKRKIAASDWLLGISLLRTASTCPPLARTRLAISSTTL